MNSYNQSQELFEETFLPGVLEISETIIPEVSCPDCLALTIVPDYKFLSLKNVVTHSINISTKIVLSTLVLNLIKLFI